jgi:diadenylate cyclase
VNSWFEKLQLLQFGWRDAIDILIVAFILYNILKLIRGTRAMQMMVGVVFLAVAYFAAVALKLIALETLARELLFYVPFAFVVLFQHEIRRALANFGRSPILSFLAPKNNWRELEPIMEAIFSLARRRVGALIAIERTQSLRMFADSGKRIDASISRELLENIFVPNTPLHDGAVVIRSNRVAAAAVFLPLSEGELPASYGTRHRAALGMSEETDAIVIAVSEESGAIGLAVDGRLHEHLSESELRSLMLELTASRRSEAAA